MQTITTSDDASPTDLNGSTMGCNENRVFWPLCSAGGGSVRTKKREEFKMMGLAKQLAEKKQDAS